MSADVQREKWREGEERRKRIVRLVIHGRGAQAQMLLEAEAQEEQARVSSYTREPDRGAA